MHKPSIFSFFSGAGFLDLGFEHEGGDVCYVNEFHPPFLDAYKHSRSVMGLAPPRFGYDPNSIEDLNRSLDIEAYCQSERIAGNTIGFIGGPPCPDFSVAGKNQGKDGENGNLSQVYIDLICKHHPDFFLFENVKGLYRTKKHRAFFEALKRKLKRNGYALNERLINAIDYGAPQDRERIILIGFRKELGLADNMEWAGTTPPSDTALSVQWPEQSMFIENSTTDKPSNIPIELTVQYWFEKNDVTNHPNAKHCFTPRNGLPKFQTILEGDDSKKSYKRLHRWRYSPTAAYGNNEVHLHPYKARRINVAEALALQSLPRNFELPPTMTLTNMFKTVGNGVPYLAAKGLAKSIFEHLEVKNARNSQQPSERPQSSAA